MYVDGSSCSAEHIYVVARVRPCAVTGAVPCINVDAARCTLHCGAAGASSSPLTASTSSGVSHSPRPPSSRSTMQPAQSFTFDGVAGDLHTADTTIVLDCVTQTCAVSCLFEGRDATVLCCGEAKSGKTSTAFGAEGEPGLCARLFRALYTAIGATPAMPPMRHEVTLRCVLLQGEHVVDLLAEGKAPETHVHTEGKLIASSLTTRAPSPSTASPATTSTAPTIMMDMHGHVVVRGVSHVVCSSAEDVMAHVTRCRRVQAALPSSAGHVVLIADVVSLDVEVDGEQEAVAAVRHARLHLVDLASARPSASSAQSSGDGSGPVSPHLPENETASSRAEEAALRQSLAALKAVIAGLVDSPARDRRQHVRRHAEVRVARDTPSRTAVTGATPTMSTAAFSSSSSASSSSSPSASASSLPYQHRKLTTLLKGYVGGACYTVVFAHVRAEAAHRTESLATLRLAKQLLCVPVHAEAHETIDPVAQVRQLQRQVAALQSDLRLQVALNKRSAARATENLREATAAGAISDQDAASALTAGARSGAVSAAAKRRSDKAARGGTTPALDTITPLPWPTSPADAPLQAAVVDFIAGRLPTLPVTTVQEMNSCFEMLRRHIVERDMRLSAATLELRTAQASAVASAMGAAAGTSWRSADRSSRRSSSARRRSSLTPERRRTSSCRVTDAVCVGAASEARRSSAHRSSPEARVPWPPTSHDSAVSAGESVRPGQTTLLEEPSPTHLVDGGGVGVGSAPAPVRLPTHDPAVTADAKDDGDTTLDQHASTWLTSPKANKVSWLPSEAADGSAARPFPSCAHSGVPPVCAATGEAPCRVPSTLPLAKKVRSLPPPTAATLMREEEEEGRVGGGAHVADALRRYTVPFSAALSPPSPLPVPPSADSVGAAQALESTPSFPTSPSSDSSSAAAHSLESIAFGRYVRETVEGRQLLQLVRQDETAVKALQDCLHMPDTAYASTAVRAARQDAIAQLTCRRQALLDGFETWNGSSTQAGAFRAFDASPVRHVSEGEAHHATAVRLRPASAGLRGRSADVHIPRLRMRPAYSTPIPTPVKTSKSHSPISPVVAASIYRV